MNRRESVEFVNMCMIQNGDKVLVQYRVNPDWPGITFPSGRCYKFFKNHRFFH